MTFLDFVSECLDTGASVVTALLPLVALFLVFQVFLLDLPRSDVKRILVGTAISGVGLFLFLLGVAIGFMPAGTAIGQALGSLESKWLLFPAGAFLGFVTTWGEPAVRILAEQVDDASNGSIKRGLVVTAVAAGVSVSVGLGLLRIAYGIPLLYLLVPGYLLVLLVLRKSNPEFVAIAVDAGGVATGPLATSSLLALALGTAGAVGGDPMVQGLGLVALIALAPVVSVMAVGLFVGRAPAPPKEQ